MCRQVEALGAHRKDVLSVKRIRVGNSTDAIASLPTACNEKNVLAFESNSLSKNGIAQKPSSAKLLESF